MSESPEPEVVISPAELRPVLSVCIFQLDGELGYTVHSMEGDEPVDITSQFELANVETGNDHRGGFALLRKK